MNETYKNIELIQNKNDKPEWLYLNIKNANEKTSLVNKIEKHGGDNLSCLLKNKTNKQTNKQANKQKENTKKKTKREVAFLLEFQVKGERLQLNSSAKWNDLLGESLISNCMKEGQEYKPSPLQWMVAPFETHLVRESQS